MKTLTTLRTLAVLFLLMPAPYAMSADQTIMGEQTVLPYTVSPKHNSAEELSTIRTFLSRDQKINQEIATLASLTLIDFKQSVDMFYGSNGYHELNPILGKKPTSAEMLVFGLVGVSVFYVFEKTLPDPWKQVFADSVFVSEQMNIEDNRRIYEGYNTNGPPIRGRSFNGVPIVISFRL